MGTRARGFFTRFNRVKLSAPLVEASLGDPELLGQLTNALAGPHALYSHALELPGIPLSFLHSCFLSRRVCPSRVCQLKGSFHRPTHEPTGRKITARRIDSYAGEPASDLLRGFDG